MPDVDLITEVLDQHHVTTDWFRRWPPGDRDGRSGYGWSCSCLIDCAGVDARGDVARSGGARHQAEQVAEALRHEASEVTA